MSKTAWGLFSATLAALAALIAPAEALAQNKRVCVEVVLSRPAALATGSLASPAPTPAPAAAPVTAPAPVTATWAVPGATAAPVAPAPVPPAATPPAAAPPAAAVAGSDADVRSPDAAHATASLPLGQRPLNYLKRLLEYFISHEKGFTAVPSGCAETVHVEMYPLVDGWTVFVRYTGTGREERVDRLLPNELSQFAERAATALLYGKPISATINRENVLVSDSKEYAQRLRGTHHFIMGVGTQLRVGQFGTATAAGTAVDQYRFFSPVSFFMGYRGRFESWGLETNVLAAAGTTQTALKSNPAGGHVDLEADGALQLHFLHYFDPRGLMSFYLGGGSTFELLWFQAIRSTLAQKDGAGARSNLLGGGLDADLVLGWEFMRASTAQFFLQGELQIPAYVLSNENNDGALHSWFPALGVKLGVLF